jgi:translation initiation factor IF-3
VRLIDENGTQVGIVSVREAIMLAEERGYDLVEVAPNAVPPVCRLLDYGKFRYEQSKKEREARKNQKQADLKQLRLMPKIDDHDLAVKAKTARRFLLAGNKVKFNVRFRGREMAHPDIGRKMLEDIAEQLRDVAVVEQRPLMEGRVLSLLLAPNPKVLKAAQDAQKAKARDAQAARSHSAGPAPVHLDEEELDDDELDEEELDDDELDDDELDDDELDDDELDDDEPGKS